MNGNFGFTERTLFFRFLFHFFLCMQAPQLTNVTDNKKYHEADNKMLSGGIKMSFTRELTMPVKALPIIIPIARSIYA